MRSWVSPRSSVLARTDRSAPTLKGVHAEQVRGDPNESLGSTVEGRKIFRHAEQRKALNMNPANRMGVAESLRTESFEPVSHIESQRIFIQYKSH
jgi:hypothetical protein